MRRLPPLNALRAFEAAARHLSFKQAAEELHVTPTAISHQIKLLEDICGHNLFRRRPRPITLTSVGERLFPVLRDGFDRFAGAVDNLATEAQRAPLRISTTTAFARFWLLPRLPCWRETNPDIELDVHASEDIRDLHAGEADLAIRYAPASPRGLKSVALFRDYFVPVTSPRLLERIPITKPSDFSKVALLHYPWKRLHALAPSWEAWIDAAQNADHAVAAIDARRGPRFSEEAHAIEAAIAGQGVVLASSVLVSHELRSGALVQLFDTALPGLTFFLVSLRDAPRMQLIDDFTTWVRDIGCAAQESPE